MKNRTLFSAKNLSLDIVDMDTNTRIVSGYFAVFDNIDSDDEVIRRGAFETSILEKGALSSSNRKIAHLFNHDVSQPIAVIKELFEDDYGLKFVSKLGRSRIAEDVFFNYQDGILREHSIGFFYKPDKVRLINVDGKEVFELNDVDLVEGSTLTFGANSLTRVLTVAKGQNKEEILKALNNEMGLVIKSIINGNGTDTRLEDLELQLQIIQAKYNELISLKSPEAIKQEIKEEIKDTNVSNELKNYYLHLFL